KTHGRPAGHAHRLVRRDASGAISFVPAARRRYAPLREHTRARGGRLADDVGFVLFGLTGGLASGKSSVARRWRERGLPVIDADDIARDVLAPGSSGL